MVGLTFASMSKCPKNILSRILVSVDCSYCCACDEETPTENTLRTLAEQLSSK